jgi:phenylalanyl-tRNA synthetase beta chain
MKLSLAWIFDHIHAPGKSRKLPDYDMEQIMQGFSLTPVDIEQVHEVSFDLQDFSLVQVLEIHNNSITVESFEWRKKIVLPNIKSLQKNGFYLVKKEDKEYRWATLTDFGAHKEGLVPEVYCNEQERAGGWKKNIETHDYIIEIDNISITHRPDMWNHRGCARELAAALGMPLIPEEHIIVSLPIHHYAHKTLTQNASAQASGLESYSIEIESGASCNRFAGIELSNVSVFPSSIRHTLRLAKLDVRSHNIAVDLTNYVMLDVGNPMHVFDAKKIEGKTLVARRAHKGEKLTLLDDTTIELTSQDCVIADAKEPLSLAGIIGGKESGVQQPTTLFLEAAHFDPVAIRKSATYHKKRTESSIRFEKGLDPHGNTTAIMRYIKLLDDLGITYSTPGFIISVGGLPSEKKVTVDHHFIAERLGTTLLAGQVESILRRLGFGIIVSEGVRGGVYQITVPTWRAKDITTKEDIVEEIGRFIGYNNIKPVLPLRAMTPQDQSAVFLCRKIKQQCAFGLQMREVANYALYDENFLRSISLNPEATVALKNPLSEHWQRLVTSLIPHLLKNVEANAAQESALRFFEWAKVWNQDDQNVQEHTVCSGIFYERYGAFTFYDGKAALQTLFNLLGILVEWRKIEVAYPWMNAFQTAALICQDRVIGYAGMINDEVIARLMPVASEAKMFAFELNMERIAGLSQSEVKFHESSKYQSVTLDISMLAPYAVTVAMLEDALARADARIQNVLLLDVFEKPEWNDRRSLTLRCVVQDNERTMTKEDIDQVLTEMQEAVKRHGVEVR